MSYGWITLVLFLSGGRAFMIHNTECSLCLEDSAATGEVFLKECNLDSEFQQWIWIDQRMLMCVASSRCLSAQQTEAVHTQPCQVPEVDSAGLLWDCDKDILISRNTSMFLSAAGQRLILSRVSKHSKWRSLDKGDVCQEKKIRLRRTSDEPDEFEAAEEQTGDMATMTQEEREYLRWFYRTEDSTTWNFVLLGLSFICLLVGFLLLGMGAMANKSRKKIAKYKAAASLAQKGEGEVLKIISPLTDDNCSKQPSSPSSPHRHGNSFAVCDRDMSELRAGDIVVTWKDGNTSCLYSDPAVQDENETGEQGEKQEMEQVKVAAAELEVHDGGVTIE